MPKLACPVSETSLASMPVKSANSAIMSQNHGETQVIVSRGDILLLCLQNPSCEVDRMVQRLAFNYILTDGDLYTVETLKMILF